ncbi:MAG: RNA polymerase sigma factor [Patescibacteria group bacterium]|nr:RNA polymerase sigma factor [Patescibacteria group bacterium]
MIDINDEKSLVKRILAKDEQAFLLFVRANETNLFHYVYRQINDRDAAEEIVQDVFVDFLEALRSFHFQCSLKTYLFSIAKFKVIDAIRKKKIKKVIFSALPDYVVEGLSPVIIDDTLEKKELADKIHAVIAALPHEYQVILRLKYVDEVRVKAIAERLSLTFKATESLLFRARKAFIKLFHQTV